MDSVEIDGHKYVAKDGWPGKCDGCALKDGFGCRLAAAYPDALSYCSGNRRADGRHMIFVPAWTVKEAS